MMAVLLPVGVWIGVNQAYQLQLPPELFNLQDLAAMDPDVMVGLKQTGLISFPGAVYIWLHNLRAVLIATVLGVFSFGVLGALVLMLPMIILGFLAQSASYAGFNPGAFLAAFTLPHAVFEIPAIIISGALIFRVGATLVTPAQNETIGEAWLRGLADWARVMLVVVAPLYFLAALLEVFVTPQVMLLLLGR
jgi:uncharacterized membrane protein SpoIIM required for sporulation